MRNLQIRRVHLGESFGLLPEVWSPRIVAKLNEHVVKIVRCRGEFVWHAHKDQDEMFLVTRGCLRIYLEGAEIGLEAGDLVVIPKGTPHLPVAPHEAEVVLIEPVGTINTGGTRSMLTAQDKWL